MSGRRNHRKPHKELKVDELVEIDVLKTPRGPRVLSNTPLEMARDVHSDLTRAATLEGSHAYAAALGLALNGAQGEDEQ